MLILSGSDSGEDARRLYRQQADKRSAYDVVARQGAPHPAVRALRPVISHDKILVSLKLVALRGPVAVIDDVRLAELQLRTVFFSDGNGVAFYGDRLFRQADDAFDKKFFRILRIAEDDDVAAVGGLQAVGNLVDYQVLPVAEGRVHAGAGDNKRLRDKKPYGEHNRRGDEYEFEELGEKILTILLWHGDIVICLCYNASMSWIIVGLGNPDHEYISTRHNVCKDFVEALAPKLPKKAKVAELNVYMNNSGGPIKKLIASKKAAEQLIVVHDELDLPLGRVKVSFGSSAGGHNGVKSIEKALKTRDYARVRVGISPSTASGQLKRPDAEKITGFVLGKFKASEQEKLKKARKVVGEALELILTEGKERAMTEINSK